MEDDPDRARAGPFGQGFWLDINLYNWPKLSLWPYFWPDMTYQIEPKSDIMSLERIVGRKVEKGILELVSKSADPEFVAVYG